jgi:hypothetical protein
LPSPHSKPIAPKTSPEPHLAPREPLAPHSEPLTPHEKPWLDPYSDEAIEERRARVLASIEKMRSATAQKA